MHSSAYSHDFHFKLHISAFLYSFLNGLNHWNNLGNVQIMSFFPIMKTISKYWFHKVRRYFISTKSYVWDIHNISTAKVNSSHDQICIISIHWTSTPGRITTALALIGGLICAGVVLFIIGSTIVLALIPVYLTQRSVTTGSNLHRLLRHWR